MGKRITLSRPRMLGSFADESVDRAALFELALRIVDTGVFLPDDLRVTVDDEVVTSVVVETVSTRGVAVCAAVEDAAAVSAAEFAERAQPAANATATNAPASDRFVIGRFLEWLEVQWVFVASLSPRHPS